MKNFITKSNEKFGDIFDFEKSKYGTLETKIEFFCKVHNEKICLSPKNHLRFKFGGCNICKENDTVIKKEEREKNSIKECKEIKEITLFDGEIAKDVNITEYKDLYIVTSMGRCFSKKTNHELAKTIKMGYDAVTLSSNSNPIKKFRIHYLMYVSFNDDYDNKKVIDHIDGNRRNNLLSNLRLVTQSENMKNAHKNNTKLRKQHTICAFDMDNKFIKEFDSTKDAAIFIGHKGPSCICDCLRGTRNSVGGYIWKYKNDNAIEKENIVIDINKCTCVGKIGDNDFSHYYINEDGVIIHKKYNRVKKQFKSEDGYQMIHLYCSIKKINKTFTFHRLFGKFFLKDGHKYYDDKNYVVNHINEDKSDNRLDNLEWITIRQNTIHSTGKKVAKIDSETNKILKVYNSIADAYVELKQKRNGNIARVCTGTQKRHIAYGFKWKYIE